MKTIKAIADIIVTALVGVPLIIANMLLAGIFYVSGGFIIYLSYLCIDTINVIFGGDTEQFWKRNSHCWEFIRQNMIKTINAWFN